ncbi:hypothetical protein AB0Q54_05905 [Enterococcus faecalis]|nr:hypothetical protein [Enterococcus faecalis]
MTDSGQRLEGKHERRRMYKKGNHQFNDNEGALHVNNNTNAGRKSQDGSA